MAEKSIGLSLSVKNRSAAVFQSEVSSVFNQDSESEDEAPVKKSASQKFQEKYGNLEARNERAVNKVLEEDASIYDYDAYTENKEKRKAQIKEIEKKQDKDGKPKYMDKLMKAKDKRDLEKLIVEEAKQNREREEEGGQFDDKEVFVTGAYRKQIEEKEKIRKEIEEEERINDINDVSKSSMYRETFAKKLLDDRVAERELEIRGPALPEVKDGPKTPEAAPETKKRRLPPFSSSESSESEPEPEENLKPGLNSRKDHGKDGDRREKERRRSRSKTPERRKERSRSPERRKQRSRSPDRRKDRSRSPDRRKPENRTPERRKERSRSPERRTHSRNSNSRTTRSPLRKRERSRERDVRRDDRNQRDHRERRNSKERRRDDRGNKYSKDISERRRDHRDGRERGDNRHDRSFKDRRDHRDRKHRSRSPVRHRKHSVSPARSPKRSSKRERRERTPQRSQSSHTPEENRKEDVKEEKIVYSDSEEERLVNKEKDQTITSRERQILEHKRRMKKVRKVLARRNGKNALAAITERYEKRRAEGLIVAPIAVDDKIKY